MRQPTGSHAPGPDAGGLPTLPLAVGLLSLTALFSGCTRYVDMDRVRASIAKGVAEQTGAAVGSVECPERRAARPGDRFECTASIDGGRVTVRAIQDEYANVKWELRDKVLAVEMIEAEIRGGLQQHLRLEATVECGPRHRPATPGVSFDCRAQHGGKTTTVRVAIRSGEGVFDWAPLDLPAAGAKPSPASPRPTKR